MKHISSFPLYYNYFVRVVKYRILFSHNVCLFIIYHAFVKAYYGAYDDDGGGFDHSDTEYEHVPVPEAVPELEGNHVSASNNFGPRYSPCSLCLEC